MSATNICFLAASLVLQLLLLWLIVTWRLTSQLYLFTILLGFYITRSVILGLLFHWVSAASYAEIYSGLSAVDVLLQVALAIEFALLILRAGPKPLLPRAFVIPAIFFAALGLTAGITTLLPSHSRAPADRAGVFTGILFIGLLLWSQTTRLPRWPSFALAGLAGLGAASILTQFGKSHAALHQDVHAYRLWSYSNAAAYVIVVLFWIFQWRPGSPLRPSLRVSHRSGPVSPSPDTNNTYS